MADTETRAASYRELFAVREYRTLFAANVCSMLGDQIAVVALAVLVYERSGSPLLAAAGYSLVFLPWFAGGPLLAALADRWPRRQVLLLCLVAQSALIGTAALPRMPLAALVVCVTIAAFLGPPFEAARGALLPQILDDDRYVVASSVSIVTYQAGQLVGFVLGGSLVALISANGALALDAISFLVAAALVRRGVHRRPLTRIGDKASRPSLWHDTVEGVRVVFAHPRVRGLLLFVWGVAMYAVVPEALAVPYAAQLGLGAEAVGPLMAAAAGGCVVGTVALTRLVPPARRLRLMRPLGLAGAVPMLVAAAHPGLIASLALFMLVGAGGACMLPARAAVMTALPDEVRGRVFGIAATGLAGAQLLGVLGAGAAAQAFAPTTVVAVSGLLGVVGVGALTLSSPVSHGAHRRRLADLSTQDAVR